ncbi:transmembrane channel-like protein 7 isoform X2 [Xenia sp. Carnegie-2017]|uniref:transmembrane channel-like protein 7 isoform X2 n=1 Tax=Xenia sp. Carnegie-2017 TaxID=2897299 RepID=UPI001F049E93|nr:transmembrane channel-like protein 7 isoform X2 [Xenia sp. Carnegie-2017]
MPSRRIAPLPAKTTNLQRRTNMEFLGNADGMQMIRLDSANDDHDNGYDGRSNNRNNRIFQEMPSHKANRTTDGSKSALSRRGHTTTRRRRGSQNFGNTSNGLAIDIEDDSSYPSESYRDIAAPIATKRSVRKAQRSEHSLPRNLSFWKAMRLRYAMWWHLTKQSIKESIHALELWKGHLKEIEGQFGNGVLSFFLFLKWLMFLDLLIFILQFSFIALPTLIMDEPMIELPKNSTFCRSLNNSEKFEKNFGNEIVDFMTGQGWINTTIMFYGSYPAGDLTKGGATYKLPLAYVLVGVAYLFLSLLLMVSSLAKNFQQSYIEGGGQFHSFCNKVFASWDFCITDEKTAKIKSQNFTKDVVGTLEEIKRWEEFKNRSNKKKFKLYTVRLIVVILVMAILAGSTYAIFFTTEIALKSAEEGTQGDLLDTVERYAPSLTISILNLIVPPIFAVLCSFEEYSPSFELAMNLFRTVLLKLASVASLVITLYIEASDIKKCDTCWENQVAAQMYMLIWIDLIIVLLTTLLVDSIYRLLFDHWGFFGKVAPSPEFDITKNVLELVYSQALIWIGCYFSPLMAAMGVVKLFILFYAKKIGLMFSCKPSSKPYNSSRANYLFTMLLLLSYLICLVAIGYAVTRIKTSCCGPFGCILCIQV